MEGNRTEWRLVKVQGDSRVVCSRGTEAYVRGSFTEFAAYVQQRPGQPPVQWDIEQVQVTEEVRTVQRMTDAEVQAAKDMMPAHPPQPPRW